MHEGRITPTRIPHPGQPPEHGSASLKGLVHPGNPHGHSLMLDDRPASLDPLVRVLYSRVKRSAAQSHRMAGQLDFARNSLRTRPPFLASQQVFHRHLYVVEVELSLKVDAKAHLVVDGGHLEARRVRRN